MRRSRFFGLGSYQHLNMLASEVRNLLIAVLASEVIENAPPLVPTDGRKIGEAQGVVIGRDCGVHRSRDRPFRADPADEPLSCHRCLIYLHELRRTWKTGQGNAFEPRTTKIVTSRAVRVDECLDELQSHSGHFFSTISHSLVSLSLTGSLRHTTTMRPSLSIRAEPTSLPAFSIAFTARVTSAWRNRAGRRARTTRPAGIGRWAGSRNTLAKALRTRREDWAAAMVAATAFSASAAGKAVLRAVFMGEVF